MHISAFQTLALLLFFAAGGAYINLRFLKLPGTVGLMAVALLLSLTGIGLHRLGIIDLQAVSGFVGHIDFSAILLHGILSFLLFAGALQIDLSELRRHGVVIGILATFGTLLATLITGSLVWQAAGWLGYDFPYIQALIFGALIAPTDPVAVMGILKSAGMSSALRVKIGCESLFNDGVGVVIFLVLLATAMPSVQTPGAGEIALLVLQEGIGAILLGLALGWLAYRLLSGIDDYQVEVLLTLALAAGTYALAERWHVSAPIAVVVAGLVIGNHGRAFAMSKHTRQHLDMFWELIDEILNAMLFMLMGLEIIVMPLTPVHLMLGLVAILATLAGRFISVAGIVSLLRLREPFERGTIRLMSWGGLRGGISIALALSLPNDPDGPAKYVILGMTYITVVFSVLVQGISFRHVARRIVKD